MSEQQSQTTAATDEQISGPDDSEPTPERQAELRTVYESNVKVGKPPYAGVVIGTRGELKWIFRERSWKNIDKAVAPRDLPDLRDVGIRADVRGIDLSGANLSGAIIDETNLSDANLDTANLSGAIVIANFREADLSYSNLTDALITGDFRGAYLTRARMNAGTVFGGDVVRGGVGLQVDATTHFLDASWNGANLALVNWNEVPRFGDEADIKGASSRAERVQAYRDAARAYYGLTKALDAQGLTAPALRYRRRQHQLERAALLRDFKFGQWTFSAILNIVSGYGDRPGRALRTYLAVIALFAAVYFGITNFGIFTSGSQPLHWYEAIVLSLTSFHGRGFFPQFSLGDSVAVVAALEAVVGLFIELVLIATFTRRLFER